MIYMLLMIALWCLLVHYVKQAEAAEKEKTRGEQHGMRTISSFRRAAQARK